MSPGCALLSADALAHSDTFYRVEGHDNINNNKNIGPCLDNSSTSYIGTPRISEVHFAGEGYLYLLLFISAMNTRSPPPFSFNFFAVVFRELKRERHILRI